MNRYEPKLSACVASVVVSVSMTRANLGGVMSVGLLRSGAWAESVDSAHARSAIVS